MRLCHKIVDILDSTRIHFVDHTERLSPSFQEKKQVKMSGDQAVSQLILVILAIFIPPLAIFLHAPESEKCGMHFWLNILLCIFFWIPGILHAAWYVFAR
mmetsp:Transcript_12696/g.36526  ORF Transcript_12696/g.36526 Transcript_12696/m.36526 type:complete len:100 (+) Transcript_12696:17-316(+)